MTSKIIQLPKIGTRAFDVWNYRYIWERSKIINEEKQIYLHPMDDPIELEQVLPTNGKRMRAMNSSPRVLSQYKQPFQSVLLTTHKKVAFKFGEINFHVNLPALKGLWAALWMLREYQQWPDNKPILPEIDILEWLADGVAHSTIHYYVDDVLRGSHKGLDGVATGAGKTKLENFSPDTIYKFSMKWDDMLMGFYIDDKQVVSFTTPNDMQAHFHILMNIAVGGSWPEAAGYKVDPNRLPDSMEVHKVTIESENFLYPIPASCSVLDTAENLPVPTLNKKKDEAAPIPNTGVASSVQVSTDTPVSVGEQKRAEALIADAETGARTPSKQTPELAKVHGNLSMNLLKTGWFIEHHPEYIREIVQHYLTGKKTHPVLDTPEFVISDASVKKAWGGVLRAFRLVAYPPKQ